MLFKRVSKLQVSVHESLLDLSELDDDTTGVEYSLLLGRTFVGDGGGG